MSKPVYCDKCSREIEFRGDLVTSAFFLKVVPYHEECFAKDLKGFKTLFVGNHPINGFSGNVTTILAILIGMGWLVFAEGSLKWAAILALLQVFNRLYSFFIYEKDLEK